MSMFRFHTGSIKSNIKNTMTHNAQMFRFHTGSIKSLKLAHDDGTFYIRFDSILVRLKALPPRVIKQARTWFRFHTGSIKSTPQDRGIQCRAVFRFHTGSIKSMVFTFAFVIQPRFDSILVRLKVPA